MSKVAELAYDIEQMFIDGYGPVSIATLLDCPLEIVYAWFEDNGVMSVAHQDTAEGAQVFDKMIKDIDNYYGA
jgi:hypothetical protein